MFSADRTGATEPIIDIDALKNQFPQYYSCLSQDEIQPYKIILCSGLLTKKDELLEKLVLIYRDNLIIIKNISGRISKLKLNFSDINYVINEGRPNSNSITIDYKYDLRERIYYDLEVNDLVNGLLLELRKKLIENTLLLEKDDYSDLNFSDAEENKYQGAVVAKAAVMDKASILCSLKQKKIHHYPGLVFSKVITLTHFTVVCKKEIIIFMEKVNYRANHTISGDIIHIPLGALKNVALEATGKGMIMKYTFNTEKKLEMFYENERTDQLLKIMSYINSMLVW